MSRVKLPSKKELFSSDDGKLIESLDLPKHNCRTELGQYLLRSFPLSPETPNNGIYKADQASIVCIEMLPAND